MKKNMYKKYAALICAAAFASALSACSGGSTAETTEAPTSEAESESAVSPADEDISGSEVETADAPSADEETAGLANPWTESDKDGVLAATGIELNAPDDAEDVVYSYMAEEKMAQISYVLNGEDWTYRAQPADELTDISGCYYEWTSIDDGTVSGRPAKYYYYVIGDLNDPDIDDVEVVNWYDVVPGVTYSLSVFGGDLNGLDIQVVAENIFEPLQGEATDDPEGDRTEELNDYFLGTHTSSYDGSTLAITDNNDETFKVDIDLYRLCSLENGVGTFEEHKMYFTVDDPNGEKLSGMIYRDSDNSLTIKITDSSWTYLHNDDTIEGFGR